MILQMDINELTKTGNKWKQAIVRAYSIEELLTDDAVRWLNSDGKVVFEISKRERDPDEGGPYTLLNVYVESEEGFDRAKELLELLGQRIACVRSVTEARAFFVNDI